MDARSVDYSSSRITHVLYKVIGENVKSNGHEHRT